MCGICGQVDPRGVSEQAIKTMASGLSHRGPDGEGTYFGPIVGLGHRRLSIIDLDGGRQPMSNEDGSIWITFNGEIYNYRELRQRLEASHAFATNSDTEVILHLYEEKGRACVDDLRGMFAFAIWNANDRSLFLARDHLGQKPLFYTQSGERFTFASEIKALLALDPSLRAMDPCALHQYLTLRIIASPRTMFSAVRKLPPAHTILFKGGRVTIERYWTLHYEPKLRLKEADLLDRLEEHALEAVRYHMVSDVPVGAFLSGGLDSSLIVAMMRKVTTGHLQTFSGDVPYEGYSEAPYARLVAGKYGTDHREDTIVPSLVRSLPDVVWHLDEPSDPLSVCMYDLAEMASRHVKVVLGGEGGDELFGGYDRYYGNQYVDYYRLLPSVIRTRLVPQILRALSDGFWYKSPSHKLRWLNELSFVEGGERYARSLSYFYFGNRAHGVLFGDRLKAALNGFDPEESIRSYFDASNAADAVDKMIFADSMVRMPDHPVMILDRTTMAHGLEARAPFMDHKLAEFMAQVPSTYKVRGRTRRYLEMRLGERYLPPAVVKKRKQGFSSALPYLLAGSFRQLFQAFLFDSHLVRDGFLRDESIRSMLGEHLGKKIDHGNRLWLLANAEIWYRMAIESWTSDVAKERLSRKESYNVLAL